MEIKSLFLGLIFSLANFAVKSGAGLSYLFRKTGGMAGRLRVIAGFVVGYGLVFGLAWLLVSRVELLAHLDTVMSVFKNGMTLHFLLATLLLVWGAGLLKKKPGGSENSRGWLALALPCPVCFSVILFTGSLLHNLLPDLPATLARELRSRYLNPKWIEGMKKEEYAGAREMSHFVEYLWGWQVTTPDKVDAAQWQQIHEVYVEDKYGQELKEFFNRANPWAYQSITARMLEAVRKGYWQPDEAVQKKLAAEYAVNVVEKGVACCDHTCNNPLLNQMVVCIISLPGVLSPEMVEQFKLAIEQAAQKSLAEQVIQRENLQRQLTAPGAGQAGARVKENQPRESGAAGEGQVSVEGYKMKKMKNADDSTEVSSSGVEWLAGLVVLAIIGLAAWGLRRGTRTEQ